MAGNLGDEFSSCLEDEFLNDEVFVQIDEAVECALRRSAQPSSITNPESVNGDIGTSTNPLGKFRGHLGYVSVTDLVSQYWCEQQMEYGYSCAELLPEKTPTHIQQGADIHMAKELELYDVVPISIKTKEDKWAVVCLNFLNQLSALDACQTVRELPVFGEPYGMGLFVYGIIDELRFNSKRKLEILEVKTRSSEYGSKPPSKAQQNKNSLQVLIYYKMFNDLISGKIKSKQFLKFLKLSGSKLLSEEPIAVAKGYGIDCKNMDDLTEILFKRLQISDLPKIESIAIEYISQQDCSVLRRCDIPVDEGWLESQFNRLSTYWTGYRTTMGVDIEEAWKCHRCDFVDICEWRKTKEQECRMRNKRKAEK
ncbi:predicted protein [Nematostella vectensis]|uniref:Exonuclease V n=1 Tax=Nematostella vectensis TaxID=45351 RepID=A7SXK9_NEMVE|nr:exonuclease V [Nematostella vectensis]EDO31549.1 predicted protein [Nematostella vectensis]|eukprot:XP_001623649.1 predicted protein [Nematostella vectensis]